MHAVRDSILIDGNGLLARTVIRPGLKSVFAAFDVGLLGRRDYVMRGADLPDEVQRRPILTSVDAQGQTGALGRHDEADGTAALEIRRDDVHGSGIVVGDVCSVLPAAAVPGIEYPAVSARVGLRRRRAEDVRRTRYELNVSRTKGRDARGRGRRQ